MISKKIFFISIIGISLALIFIVFLNIYWLNQKSNLVLHNQTTNNQPSVKGVSINKMDNSPSNDLNNNSNQLQNNNQQQSVDQSNQIPVLMYHYIRDYNNSEDKIGTNLSVSPQKFAEQLYWLKDHGYKAINFNDLFDLNQKTLTQTSYSKLIILTFDDGYEDAYTNAFPLLKKYSFTATFYIITNNVGKDNFMTWNQIIELKNNGMNIGSHTLAHPDLSKASNSRAEKEISQSKKIIEGKIGVTISDFCYPSGKHNQDTINLLKKYSYQTASTTKSGIYDSSKNSAWEIPRYRITNQTNLSKLLP